MSPLFTSVRSVIFDIHRVLMTNDSATAFSQFLAKKAAHNAAIDSFWSGDVRALLYGLLTKYCPLCDYRLCKKEGASYPGGHIRSAVDKGELSYDGFKVAMTYMLTHFVDCPPKARIVLDYAAEFYSQPSLLMENAQLVTEGVQLFFRCIERFGPEHVFFMSNMPAEMFSLFACKFPHLTTAIPAQNAFIAGHVGMVKPDAAFFKAVTSRVGGAPQTLLLIDDQEKNVRAAQESGWQSLLFSPKPSPALASWYDHLGLKQGKR